MLQAGNGGDRWSRLRLLSEEGQELRINITEARRRLQVLADLMQETVGHVRESLQALQDSQ